MHTPSKYTVFNEFHDDLVVKATVFSGKEIHSDQCSLGTPEYAAIGVPADSLAGFDKSFKIVFKIHRVRDVGRKDEGRSR